MTLSTSGFITSSDLPKGQKLLKKLLYVQHVDKEKKMTSEIPDRYLEEFLLADRTNFHDSNITEYLKSPKENLGILKSSLEDEITEVTVYSNPLPIPLQLPGVMGSWLIHEFVVFQTWNYSFRNSGYMWWSIEKNGRLVLQQSPNEDDVKKKIYDTEKKKSVERFGQVRKRETERGWRIARVGNVLRMISDNDQISEPYHLLFSNCQHFTSFIYEQLTGEKWSTKTSAFFNRIVLKKKKIHPKIKEDTFKYKSILNDNKFDFYRAMMEGKKKDFKKLNNNLMIETLNSVDSQGYTLLEWATVFSSSDWPIDEELKKKGAVPAADEKLFHRNVFFITLQYLPPNKKLLSLDGIDKKFDISGVNRTDDTALHLALYGEKWGMAVKILNRFENYDVNTTNIRGDTPLHLAAKFNCGFGLFKKILNRTNQENINKVDGIGNTALHYAIGKESEPAVKELLNRKDVDVDIQNYINKTPLYLASQWEDIPVDLLNLIREKSTDVNAQDINGATSLHCTISIESETAINELPKQKTSSSGSGSSGLAIGIQFIEKLLYVQHVDKEKNMVSEISNRCLQEYLLADRNIFSDSNFTEYLQNSNENRIILKRSMKDKIRKVTIYSNPLSSNPLSKNNVTIHAFVVFETENDWNGSCKKTWWSLEKNGKYIVLQQSPNEDDVINKIYDTEKKKNVERLGPIKKGKSDFIAVYDRVENVLRIIWETNQLSNRYHFLFSNCHNFASFVFEKLSHGRKKWSTKTSAIVDRIGWKNKKIQPGIKVDAFKYKTILNDDKFECCKALMEGRMEDYEELTNNLTIETLNSVDSQGYTLLEWATVFSTFHWPIDEELKKIGAEIPLDEKLFKQNVFFIALQYLPPNQKSKLFGSLDEIDIHGVNPTGDTALHLALYGKKWEMAVKFLKKFEEYDVNRTNNREETPLHLASKFNCGFGLFKKILHRTNSEYVNKMVDVDENGWTALHYAIDNESKPMVKKLITRNDVKVNLKNNDNVTANQLASKWKDIPSDLLKLISDRSANEAKEN